jgi:predicted small lipoprotein YifL
MLRSATAIVLLSLVVNACGTRGPLYLPPEQKPPQQEQSRK